MENDQKQVTQIHTVEQVSWWPSLPSLLYQEVYPVYHLTTYHLTTGINPTRTEIATLLGRLGFRIVAVIEHPRGFLFWRRVEHEYLFERVRVLLREGTDNSYVERATRTLEQDLEERNLGYRLDPDPGPF